MDLSESRRTVFGILDRAGATADIRKGSGDEYNFICFSAPADYDIASAIETAFYSDSENAFIALDSFSEDFIDYTEDDINDLSEESVVIVLDERKFFGLDNVLDIRSGLFHPDRVIWLEREKQ